MSKKDTEKDTEFPAEDEFIADEPMVEDKSKEQPEEVPQLPPPAQKEKSSGGVAWLALLLALLTVAGVGYLLVQDWRAQSDAEQSESALAELSSRLASSTDSLSSLDQGLAELAQADAQAASDLEALQGDLDNRMQMLSSLPSRMSNIENSLSTLQGISTGARNTWLLAEAEYYMQIANAQLQLAGNPHLAALALGMADERIVQLADPALTDVRRALADELAALELMEKPDIEGVTLTLASLARVVDALPLRQASNDKAADGAAAESEQGGIGRAWASIKGAFTGLVEHTAPGESAVPFITPEAEYFLRTNLTLQLQSARLALLRGEQAVFEQSLDDATSWLETYFDAGSAQVSSALQTIYELRDGLFDVSTPDISESLRLLRQFNTMSETAQ
ncbi:MAG: uroporphyrinogen-III C-methyltransferase [Gammaproteobacteria bacterium]|nr:uroporphyrinogen-III C-methyltransferase [Gammaproteobacteria bacterium]